MKIDKRHGEMDQKMIELSHKAWESLMVDKLKSDFDKRPGTTMKRASKIINEHVLESWDMMSKGKKVSDSSIKKFHSDLMNAWMAK